MANEHFGSWKMTEKDAREEAQKWVENGGHVREDYPHGGNNTPHLHLYDTTKNEDFVLNYERGTGYENDESSRSDDDESSRSDDDESSGHDDDES